jgi:peptidoglycan/LPS O-acetylase OafA/YrhL
LDGGKLLTSLWLYSAQRLARGCSDVTPPALSISDLARSDFEMHDLRKDSSSMPPNRAPDAGSATSVSTSVPAERLPGADFLRAAACLMVLLHHLALHMSLRGNFGWLEPLRVFAKTGAFGVSVFFVLSGFLLARPFWTALDHSQAMPRLRTYWLRRAARIVPGFWLALTLSFLASFSLFDARLGPSLVLRYVSGLFFLAPWHWATLFPVEANGPLWSIGFEVTSYALLPLCFAGLFWIRRWVPGTWRIRLLWLVAIALVLLAHWSFRSLVVVDAQGRGWEYGPQGGAKIWMPRFNPFGFFAIFTLGALAAGLQSQWTRYRHLSFDGMTVLAIVLMVWTLWSASSTRGSMGFGVLDIPYGFPQFPLAVAAFLAVAPQSRGLGRLLHAAPLRYLSTISFGVYCWHFLVIESIIHHWFPAAERGQLNDRRHFLIVAGFSMAITIAVAHWSFHLLEQPLMRWARRLEPNPSAPRAHQRPAPGPV